MDTVLLWRHNPTRYDQLRGPATSLAVDPRTDAVSAIDSEDVHHTWPGDTGHGTAVRVSPRGHRVLVRALAGGHEVVVTDPLGANRWVDLAPGREVQSLAVSDDLLAIAHRPMGSTEDEALQVWRLDTLVEQARVELTYTVRDLAFSPDGA